MAENKLGATAMCTCSRDYGYGEPTTTKFVRLHIDPIANEGPEDTFKRFEDARKSFINLPPEHECKEVKCYALFVDSLPPAVSALIKMIRGNAKAENVDKAKGSPEAAANTNQHLIHDICAKNSACK